MADQFNSDAEMVSMPLREVLAYYDMLNDYPVIIGRLLELESEVDALRSIQSQILVSNINESEDLHKNRDILR